MLNWIDKNERLPTKEDASKDGYVYAVSRTGKAVLWHHATLHDFTHWLPFREMPIPKRWRTPTIHDLAKAGKPIPCRVRNCEISHDWRNAMLCMVSVQEKETWRYWCTDSSGYKFCEICDD